MSISMLRIEADVAVIRFWSLVLGRWVEPGEFVPHSEQAHLGRWWSARYGEGTTCSSGCPLKAAAMALELAR